MFFISSRRSHHDFELLTDRKTSNDRGDRKDDGGEPFHGG